MIRVVVVGGGIAGLATAWFLTRRAPPDLDLSVRVVEAAPAAGGRIASVVDGGVVFERGPLAVHAGAPDTRDLIEGVGLGGRPVEASAAAGRRLVLRDGQLWPVPASPISIATTGLLPWRARLRLLKEPFVGGADDHDESVAAFFARRCGDAVVPALVEPWAAHTLGGDASRLSMKCALPKLALLEREHGSLSRGALGVLRARRRRGAPALRAPGLASFPTGLAELPRAVAADLGDAVLAGCRAVTLARDGARFAVEIEGARTETLRADVLVLATGVDDARTLLDPVDPDLGATLRTLPHASAAVVSATWPRAAVAHPLDAAGFACVRAERRSILGADFLSSLFPSHAGGDTVLLRATLGGVHRPRVLDQDDDALARAAVADLTEILGIDGAPTRTRVDRHPRALPQYDLGHLSRLAALDGKLREHPNLFLTGAAYRGPSVDDGVRNGRKVGSHVLRHVLVGG